MLESIQTPAVDNLGPFRPVRARLSARLVDSRPQLDLSSTMRADAQELVTKSRAVINRSRALLDAIHPGR